MSSITYLANPGNLKKPYISLLRYPGGKSSLYGRLRTLIRLNGLSNGTYVEPYAGGAGAALALLVTGQVREIVINDLDPAVYAFWRAVVTEREAFSDLLVNAVLTVEEWTKQKEAYLTAPRDDYLTLGFATFYLNRTNRSGVLNGGPIGGKDQSGNYKIDARFNKQALSERLRLLSLYSNRISVRNEDGLQVIKEFAASPSAFVYADPPYVEKAGSLYLNSFTKSAHQSLADCINSLSETKWLLTYDDVPLVHELYSDRRRELFSLNYSAHRVAKANEVMIFSDALVTETGEDRLF
ncbi:DNA adenine methylase [Micromonospora aurantiaca (nom. illeg.)]|uniref:DNA adenine methylase n=1 Tax=Micromonospora aurantiaca (nom. illeg.) TaxID=47850 RepID=UPI0033CC1E90